MAQYDDELFEILLDKGTASAFKGGAVPWCDDQTYRCEEGPDPTIFPRGELPMKKVLLGVDLDPMANYPIASMFYAMAHRRKHVEGQPYALLRVRLGAGGQLRGFLDGSLVSHPWQHTVAFAKAITRENYVELKYLFYHEIQEDLGKLLLDYGYAMLRKKIMIEGVNICQESRLDVEWNQASSQQNHPPVTVCEEDGKGKGEHIPMGKGK